MAPNTDVSCQWPHGAPGSSGTVLSTANLGDISIEAGPVSGITVRGRSELRGDLELGSPEFDTIASISAQFSGAQ
eukprot:2030503-Rhodomonas_salina.1